MAGAVYWTGQDGNVYLKSANGVQNVGKPVNLHDNGFDSSMMSAQAKHIQDPNPGNVGKTYDAGNSGPSTSDRAMAASYGASLNDIKATLGALPTQETQGRQAIQRGADKARARLNESQSSALSSIADQRRTAGRNKAKGLSNIDANVANTIDSYKRLVAAGHAGGSLFAKEFVPMATAREGGKMRSGVFDTYGQNMGALKKKEDEANMQYSHSLQDINDQTNSKLLEFLQGIQNTRDQLNAQASEAAANEQIALGGGADKVRAALAPFQTSAAQRIAAMNSLFSRYAQPSYNVAPVQVTLPDLSQYQFDPLTAQLAGANPDVSQTLLPYYYQLKRQQDATQAPALPQTVPAGV